MRWTATYSEDAKRDMTIKVEIVETVVLSADQLNAAMTNENVIQFIYEQARAASTSAFDKVALAVAQATKTDLFWNEGTARFGLAEKYRAEMLEWQERCGAADDKLNVIAEAHRAMREAHDIIEGIE